MRARFSQEQLKRIRADYERGIDNISAIAKMHKISRPSLYNHAKKGGWIYAMVETEKNKTFQNEVVSQLLEKHGARIEAITQQFLDSVVVYMNLGMIAAKEMSDAKKEADNNGTKVSKDEYDRIYAGVKIPKTAMETLNTGYTGIRRALGLDKDQEIRKAREIRAEERNDNIVDPLKGKKVEEVKQALENLQSRWNTDYKVRLENDG